MKKLFFLLICILAFEISTAGSVWASTVHCDYTAPVNYLGETPVTTIDAFAFSKSDCISSPSGEMVSNVSASPSAYIDIASNSAFAKGIYGGLFFIWLSLGILVFTAAIFTALYWFQK